MTRLGWLGAATLTSAPGLGWLDPHGAHVSRETVVVEDEAHREAPVDALAEAPVAPDPTTEPVLEPVPELIVEPVTADVSRETSPELVPEVVVTTEVPLIETAHEAVQGADIVDETELSEDAEEPLPAPAPIPAQRSRERFPKPDDTRILTIANQKGGVGKTTTAVNLASALSAAGLKVLVLDVDPQGNASTALGIDHRPGVPGIYEVLVEGKLLAEVVQQCDEAPDLWCAPATIDLAGAEIELVSMVARESRLLRALGKYLKDVERSGQGRVDYVLIDCPPSLGLLTINAFVAAPEVLIPIQCEYYALEGLTQLLSNIDLIQQHLNPDLHVSTILLTMYDGRTRLASQVVDEVRSHFGGEVLRALVPRSVRISEAPSHGQTVMTYDPLSSGALAYLAAAREIAERGSTQAEVDTPSGFTGNNAPARDAAVTPAPAHDPWSRWSERKSNRRGKASREGEA